VSPLGEGLSRRIFAWRRAPIIFFFLLSLTYFSTFLTSDKVIFGADHDFRGYFQKMPLDDLSYYIHPPNWSPDLGGTAVSDKRVGDAFFPLVILRYLMPFYKALGWWYILITTGAGFFMYLFIRALEIRKPVAFLIGTCYMFAPTFFSFTYAGHYAKMAVISLAPLLFFCLENGMKTGAWKYFIALAGVVALEIYTSHLQLAYFSFWGAGFYFVFKLWQTLRERRGPRKVLKKSVFFIAAFTLGIGIGAMNLFPPYFHTTRVSKRAELMSAEYAASWSMHPKENIGTGIHFISLHLHEYYKNAFGFKKGDFKNAEFISERTISIPLSPKLSDEDVEDTIRAVRKVISYFKR